MVRVFIILILMLNVSFADRLDDKVQNLIGKRDYQVQKKLIGIIFKNRSAYYKNGHLDIGSVVKNLKRNSLLKLHYGSPRELKVSFYTEGYPLAFLKIINESLYSMGYSYFLTNKAVKKDDGFIWTIALKTESAIDPEFFSRELEKRGCYIEDVKRSSKTYWQYTINMVNANILAKHIAYNENVKLKKPIEPYWLNIESAYSIELKSSSKDKWYPYIVFYDQYLNMLDNYTQEKKSYNVKLEIPSNAKYAKVTDKYTLDNIRRGLSVYISK